MSLFLLTLSINFTSIYYNYEAQEVIEQLLLFNLSIGDKLC
nr:MAG TPA: hypothetical protein [Caudoviricetes sp.]